MHLTKEDITSFDRIKRLNLVNSVTGIKPANLVGTKSPEGDTNLAIISSVIHLGSNPALIGFVMRPTGDVPRHTYDNIMSSGLYTINHVHKAFIEKAHYTSAKFERHESEFEHCQLTEEYIEGFAPPFVKESQLKLGLKLADEVEIKLNGTILLIGEIEHLVLPDHMMDNKGHLDLSRINDVGISGLNSYYGLEHLETFAYARKEEMPDFN